MVASELSTLAETIEESIAIRGIYLLMDERLNLIGGPETLQNIDSTQLARKMAKFAAAHGWAVTDLVGIPLLPGKAIIDLSKRDTISKPRKSRR